MDRRVGRILELLRNEVTGVRCSQLLGLADCATHAVRARRQDQLGAVGLEQQAALAAHRLRHHEGAFDAARGADHGQADAGVAGGRFEHDRIRTDFSGGLRGIDHRGRDAIL